MRTNLRFLTIILAILALCQLGPALTSDPAGTSPCLGLEPGRVCTHIFSYSDTTTTADSDLYQVSKCTNGISYRFDGDGVALLQIKECSEKSTTGDCSTFTPDINNDGVIDSTDEATMLDGVTPGLRGFERMFPRARWHWIDVTAVPSSGNLRVTITCH